jgi:hypothetical protein
VFKVKFEIQEDSQGRLDLVSVEGNDGDGFHSRTEAWRQAALGYHYEYLSELLELKTILDWALDMEPEDSAVHVGINIAKRKVLELLGEVE